MTLNKTETCRTFLYQQLRQFNNLFVYLHQPYKDEAQTALFKDPVRTAL